MTKHAGVHSNLIMALFVNDFSDIDSNSSLCKKFAKEFEDDIKKFAGVSKDTEHQINNFGPGSAWNYEAGFTFVFKHEEDLITLTLIKCS